MVVLVKIRHRARQMPNNKYFIITAALLIAWLGMVSTSAAELQPLALRCEYRVNPEGIDTLEPRLTWQVASPQRGARQTACQILVASSDQLLEKNHGDLWDTHKIAGGQTINVPYAGQTLVSREQCFWKVRVWNEQGKPSAWSKPARWSMGLLGPTDWQAHYISFQDTTPLWTNASQLYLPPAHQYRKEFTSSHRIKRATLFATALGIYELSLNGQPVGDDRFAPGWTDYHQSAYYHTYDVTGLIRQGGNALGAWVADGWYSGYLGFGLLTGIGTERIGRFTYGKTPAFMAQLEIEYHDGTQTTISTDPSWKETGGGPIRQADFLMGEYYDARQEMSGWSQPGFDDSQWQPAVLAADNGSVPATFYEFENPASPTNAPQISGHPVDLGFQRPPRLEAFPGVPVRPAQELDAVAITSPTNGIYIFNLGQNFAGVARLKVKGAAGTVIRLRYGEMLYPDGQLMTENLRKARATDFYVLRGDPHGETYTPRFTYHGFQYVEVTGYPGKPDKRAIKGIVLQSDTPMASGFACSDPLASRLFKNIVWTQRANFIDLPTDCPQRDERFGWMGDAQIYVHCATLNADVAAFYTKWLRQVMEAQRASGTFPGYCPFPFQHGWNFGTAWCDAGVICPWTLWQAYGDKRIIEHCWPFMTKFMDWRKGNSRNFLGLAQGNDWGDWLSFGQKTPLDYIDTVYFAKTAHLMSQMAAALGKDQEAAEYSQLFANIKAAFDERYLRPDGSLTVDTQTAYALALEMDLIPGELRLKSGRVLAEKIKSSETADTSGMTTGFLGTRPLLPVLTSVEENDLAIKQFQSRKFPSWGYEVEQGATTIWEHWDSFTKDHGFGGVNGQQNASMNSFAHYSFGAVGEWMLNDLGGIQSDGPGYDKIILHPHPPTPARDFGHPPITWVKTHYDSIHGRIESNWSLKGRHFKLDTTIPANTTATVYLPTSSEKNVTESGLPLARIQHAKFIRLDNGCAILAVESGKYAFESQLAQ
jgi:alpha-L-rhamnosidase